MSLDPEWPERSQEGVTRVPQLQTAQESDISEDKRAEIEWTESKSSEDERVASKRVAAGEAISKPQCQERRQEGVSGGRSSAIQISWIGGRRACPMAHNFS